MCFFFITHPVYTQVFLRTLADVSISDMFISSFSPSCVFPISSILYCHGCPTGSRSALILDHLRQWRHPLPKIKYGESEDRIENASWKGLRWLSSESGSPEKIRPSIGMYRFLRWYRKCCCLSIFDASSAFSVLFLAKFCTSWYFRIFELNQVQMISHGVPHQLAFYSHPVITGNPLFIFPHGNTVIQVPPAAGAPSSFGSL